MGDNPAPSAKPPVRRLPLGPTRRRLSYERRIRLWLTAFIAPAILLAGLFTYTQSGSALLGVASALALAFFFAIVATYLFDQLIRPLQTLANVVAALREDDFSFRARGARRGDALGDLALEINALAGTLQAQRASARDALTLAERVMTSMQSPVLAFDATGALRLLNPAAERAFHLTRRLALGQDATRLGIGELLLIPDEELYQPPASQTTRYSVRRSTFRLNGVPHTLLVLSDVAAALREEERVAWQRLIRVLSHEIANSLTPIKSLAGSLRTRLVTPNPSFPDLHRGLMVIEERAASLNRFLQAYQQLTRLPPPSLRLVSIGALLGQVTHLETRLPVQLEPGPETFLQGDPDQLQQLLINLIRNAVEAAMTASSESPRVVANWSCGPAHVSVKIRDNGPGLLNPSNLFVPFYTTKPEGNGIGLVLAQQIASAHRGSVTLTNNLDSPGCTAELRLPAQTAERIPWNAS